MEWVWGAVWFFCSLILVGAEVVAEVLKAEAVLALLRESPRRRGLLSFMQKKEAKKGTETYYSIGLWGTTIELLYYCCTRLRVPDAL